MRPEETVAKAEGWRGRVGQLAQRAFSEAASAGSLSRVRRDLFQLAPLLQGEPRLRKTFADIGLPEEAKQGFLQALFRDRVDPQTLTLLDSLVADAAVTWRLPSVVEDLAVEATLAEAEQEGALGKVEDELFRFARTLEARPELRGAITNPVLPDANKVALLDELLDGRVAGQTMILLRHAVLKPGDPVRRIEALTDRAAARRNRVVVEARTAVELDPDRRERLAKALSKLTGRAVDLEVVVDPEIRGGVVARVGDEVIDGTVRRRLELALEQLAG
jgi:F-type H+-transporting ATPase subunit delta